MLLKLSSNCSARKLNVRQICVSSIHIITLNHPIPTDNQRPDPEEVHRLCESSPIFRLEQNIGKALCRAAQLYEIIVADTGMHHLTLPNNERR